MLVVLDACVLYPPSLRDLLLTLAAFDAFDIRWSEAILDELQRNVIADNPDIDPERFTTHTLGQMKRAFPEALVAINREDVDRLDNDPKDRHVAAVGVVAEADAVVTINVKDFRSRVLDENGIRVITPGALIDEVIDEEPELLIYAAQRISSRATKPPLSAAEVVDLLSAHPTMGAAMQRVRELMR